MGGGPEKRGEEKGRKMERIGQRRICMTCHLSRTLVGGREHFWPVMPEAPQQPENASQSISETPPWITDEHDSPGLP